MADSEQIKRVDVIAADVFTQPAEEAKILLDQINLVVKGMKEMLAVSSKDLSITTTKDSAEVAKMAAQIKDLEDKIKLLNIAKEEAVKVQKRLTTAQADEILARAKQRQAKLEEVKITSDLTSEYEKNVAYLAKMTREIKNLGGLSKAPKELADNFRKLHAEVEGVEQSVKQFQRNIGNYSGATQELRDLTRQLVALKLEGKENSEAFKTMSARAGELKDTIGDTKAQIKNLGSDTRVIDGVVGSVNLMANAFQVAEGAAALMGGSAEEWQKTMVKLQAIMAITTGLQEVGNLVQKESAAMMFLTSIQTKAAAAAQGVYAFATGGATAATKAFRIALLATGIGAIVVAIGALSGAMSTLSDDTDEEVKSQEELNTALEEYNKSLDEAIKLGKARNQGSRGSEGDLKRELNLMKAKGDSAKSIFEQEQKIREREKKDLGTQLAYKVENFKGAFYTTEEYFNLNEAIRNKQNEIDVAKLEFNRKQNEDQKKLAADKLKNLKKDAKETKEVLAKIPTTPKEAKEAMGLAGQNQLALDEAERIAKLKAIKDQQRKEVDIMLSGVQEGVERREEIVQSGIQKELTQTERAIEKQQQLAAQGLENSLAYQEKRRAELEAKAVREKEAARQKEEAIQLAGAYLSAYRSRMDKGNQTSTAALSGALSDVLLAKAISSSVAGAFAEGVEDFQGKGTGTSDSNLIAFSHGESVVTAKATKQYSGLVTAMNKGIVNDYVNEMIMPDLDARPSQNGNSFQSAAIIYALNTKLDSLEKAIKNKQEIKVNWDAQGARVEEIVKDGMRVVTKHVTTGKRRL